MFVAGIYLMDSKVKFLLAVRADETCRVVSPAKCGHLKDMFLPDPGVSGVRSMGPGVSMSVRELFETLLM